MAKSLPVLEAVGAAALVGAVALLTALPGSKGDGGAGKNLELADGLGVLRTAIFRFGMDHDDGGRGLLLPGRDGEDLVAQLVGTSRRDGSVEPAAGAFDNRWYGPYLTEIPRNPVNGLSTVRVMPPGYPEAVFTGSAGWVYLPDTGEIFPDLPGADARGVSYSTY
jgi:hypothetical protein